ncbi:electron transfer flavoprotein-ubiquinone oxidoreductase [Thermoleophilum album]|uniref:Electron transfer flavoprotein-ubiquinone oxidoreductase n=1 Tax=Thermoleophilum album TaxID=29539 RepID=A0A1H6FJK0_THEAL|nr:electron-transfer flavoprotein:ubiquinone oxidoreductase [Thermoleophilum album]SEH10338.1 electron-transferring-flavoprotein dehydrogenase [Thermoleophilum album]
MATAPAEFPPPVDPAKEFVGPPTDPPDERIEVGIAIVGGGPAGLACAIRLGQLLAEDEQLLESLGEVPIAIIEKGKTCGSHLLSGAMMRPSAMRKLFPDMPESEWPTYGTVDKDAVYLLTPKRAIPLKPTPPPFRNHGNHVTSIAQLGRWLAGKAEELGAYILPETAAVKLLVEDGRVVGVRTGDKGRDREGKELSNFEPGSDVIAKATILCEGTQGHLAGAAIRYFGLGSEDPQQWELGVKEVWEVKQPLDRVIHTMGWPLRYRAKYGEFGGSFIYPMGEDKVSLGFVAGLDYKDATFSVHDTLQLLKTHPLVRGILEGGKRIAWGAKTIPSGGYWAMPKRLWAPGMCIAGDSAGMVNVPRLKGIHYAMHAGIFAAEAVYEALKEHGSTEDLSGYERRVRESEIEKDLYEVRNMRQPFSKGFFVGGAISNAMLITKGRFPGGHWETHDDATVPVFIGDRDKVYPKPDNELTFNKLDSVFLSGNATRDDAPNHIRIANPVPLEVALMWQNMCPAQVYEVPEEELEAARVDGRLDGKKLVKVKVTASNCVQCGAITAKGGRLTPPEGGDGPNYQLT